MNSDQLVKRLPRSEYKHPTAFARMRFAAGVWLLVLTGILYGYHRGGWWRPLLVVAAALSFYAAYRLPRAIRASKESSDAP
jgi:hypothetical protein